MVVWKKISILFRRTFKYFSYLCLLLVTIKVCDAAIWIQYEKTAAPKKNDTVFCSENVLKIGEYRYLLRAQSRLLVAGHEIRGLTWYNTDSWSIISDKGEKGGLVVIPGLTRGKLESFCSSQLHQTIVGNRHSGTERDMIYKVLPSLEIAEVVRGKISETCSIQLP